MKNWWKYILVGLVVFLAAYAIALLVFGGGWWRWGMMGRWMMRPGFMQGPYFPHMGGFEWLALLGMLLIPLLILVVTVVGVVALLRGSSRASLPTAACPNCRRSIQTGWVACPYCGQDLRPGEPIPPASSP